MATRIWEMTKGVKIDEPWPMRFAGGTPLWVRPAKEKEVRIFSLTS
jgi:hypothetical protein